MICTFNYYDLADNFYSLYDWGNARIQTAAGALGCSSDVIYELIENKLTPLVDQIQAEFHKTEEFRTHEEHERITTIYAAMKAQFNEKYGTSGKEYDQCYDVFGKLQNKKRLEEIKTEHKARKAYEHQSRANSRSYYENFYNNYSSGATGRSYDKKVSDNYTPDDHAMLKKFYRTLSKAYHPDSNPGQDTAEEMKMLNKLKSDWGV